VLPYSSESSRSAEVNHSFSPETFKLPPHSFHAESRPPYIDAHNYGMDMSWPALLGDASLEPSLPPYDDRLSLPVTASMPLTSTEMMETSACQTKPPHKRKGKRKCQVNLPQDTSATGHSSSSPPSDDVSKNATNKYMCTACPRSFKNASDWKRHESGVHGFHLTEWICMLDECIVNTSSKCIFCAKPVNNMNYLTHVHQHRVMNCSGRDVAPRTFARKDALTQHVLGMHVSSVENEDKKRFRVPDTWAKDVGDMQSSPDAVWCGFCLRSFPSTSERMDHVAQHFRDGLDLTFWTSRSKAW
jgi:uncharacterized Zn-finger protein